MEVSECATGGITMLFVRLIIRPNVKVGAAERSYLKPANYDARRYISTADKTTR